MLYGLIKDVLYQAHRCTTLVIDLVSLSLSEKGIKLSWLSCSQQRINPGVSEEDKGTLMWEYCCGRKRSSTCMGVVFLQSGVQFSQGTIVIKTEIGFYADHFIKFLLCGHRVVKIDYSTHETNVALWIFSSTFPLIIIQDYFFLFYVKMYLEHCLSWNLSTFLS